MIRVKNLSVPLALALSITLAGIIANPLFAIFLALIYLKSRQTEGDTLTTILAKFESETTDQ